MNAAFYLVVLAIVWSASDLGRTVEARGGFSNCKGLVGNAIKVAKALRRYNDPLPTCKCGRYISQVEITDKDTQETQTLNLCTGCPGQLVPLKNSNYCGGCRNRRFRNFGPFCKTALDQCNGKGIKVYTCKCKPSDDDATTPIPVVTDADTTVADEPGQSTIPPMDWQY